jgi:hypothetical protein
MVDKAYETRTPIRDMILDSPLEREDPSTVEALDPWLADEPAAPADEDPGGGPPGDPGPGPSMSGADLVGAGMPVEDVALLGLKVMSAPFRGIPSFAKTIVDLERDKQLQQYVKIAEAINAAEQAGEPVGPDADVADEGDPIGAPVGPDPSSLGLVGTDADVADNDPAAFGLSPLAGTLGGYGPEGGPVGGLVGTDADVAAEDAGFSAPVGPDPASMGLFGPDADVADNMGHFGGWGTVGVGSGEGGIGAGGGIGGIGPGIGGGGFGTPGMPGEGDAGEGGGGNPGCIIVTACTSKDSPKVDITREYRDKVLDIETLSGYYLIAAFVVPFINKFKIVKVIVRIGLVERIVDYCAHALGKQEKRNYRTSKFVTEKFLGFCRIVGRLVGWIAKSSRIITLTEERKNQL